MIDIQSRISPINGYKSIYNKSIYVCDYCCMTAKNVPKKVSFYIAILVFPNIHGHSISMTDYNDLKKISSSTQAE